MLYANQAAAAQNNIHVARQLIKVQTERKVQWMPLTPEAAKTPVQMLQIIAGALNMEYNCFRARVHKRDWVELRFIAALMMRRYYPEITLKQIGVFFGGQDHTTVINAIIRANDLLKTRDFSFTCKYNKVAGSISRWLDQQ